MANDDERSQDLARYVAGEVTPEVSRFMGTVAGAPSIEISELIAEHIRAWRFKREVKHVKKAMKQLEDAGMSPKAIPMRTLAPLIEGGSLEDDESLVDRWASLLANAAGGSQDVPPSFPNVLRELDPAAARVLDVVYAQNMSLAPEIRDEFSVVMKEQMRDVLGLTKEAFAFHIDNLMRLRLVEPARVWATTDEDRRTVRLTEFGRAFVRACRPPSQPDPPIEWHDAEALRKHIADRQAREAAESVEHSQAETEGDT